ncbi:MAG: hypothetical protein ABIF10_02310 [Candidatus Woesearchaeota archaeon]
MKEDLPLGILDEDFAKYTVRFHMVRKKDEKGIRPDYELIDWLAEQRAESLPERKYRESLDYLQNNMKFILPMLYREHTSTKPIETVANGNLILDFDENPINALYNEKKNTLIRLASRIKDPEGLWKSSEFAVDKQEEPELCDLVGLRMFLENPQATIFRRIKWQLPHKDRKGFKKITGRKFGAKTLEHLMKPEKLDTLAKCLKIYGARDLFGEDFKNWERWERDIYKSWFSEENNDLCLQDADKIVQNRHWDNVPYKSHILLYGGLELRAKCQKVINKDLKSIVKITDYLFKSTGEARLFMTGEEKKLTLRENREFPNALSYKQDGKTCLLLQEGRLIIDLQFPTDTFDRQLASQILETKLQLYSEAESAKIIKENPRRSERQPPRVLSKDEKQQQKEIMEKATLEEDERILRGIILFMETIDPELRLFIYPQTFTSELQQNHRGLELHNDKAHLCLIKSHIGKDRKPNGYETAYTIIRYGPISFEVQIRDPLMHWWAEYGGASHPEHKEKKYSKLSEHAKLYGRIFFGATEQDKQLFHKFYRETIETRIKPITQAIVRLRTPYTLEDDRATLDGSLSSISLLLEKARKVLPDTELHVIKRELSDLIHIYIDSKGLDCTTYLDSTYAINKSLAVANKTLDEQVFFTYAESDHDQQKLGSRVFGRHLELVHKSLEDALASRTMVGDAAALCISVYLQNYEKYAIPAYIDAANLAEHKRNVRDTIRCAAEERKWRKTEKIPFGFLPTDDRNRLRKIFSESRITEFLTSSHRKIQYNESTLRGILVASEPYRTVINKYGKADWSR